MRGLRITRRAILSGTIPCFILPIGYIPVRLDFPSRSHSPFVSVSMIQPNAYSLRARRGVSLKGTRRLWSTQDERRRFDSFLQRWS
ncbi:hypothetical protein GE21DRAFT_1069948 [Neurospora crassa]|nr:hypothetical protein GE21DRAFT_1069948 [Neurospora crassa]